MEIKISLFSLKEVRLLDSDFKHIMDLNHAYKNYPAIIQRAGLSSIR
mgnify:FL=1